MLYSYSIFILENIHVEPFLKITNNNNKFGY
jgi:hypothetical protein